MATFITRFDDNLTHYVQSWPKAWDVVMKAATFLGNPPVVVVASLSGFLISLYINQPKITAAIVFLLVGEGLNATIKQFLHRTRPDTLYVTTMKFKSYSFPSGHSFAATALYGFLDYLAYSQLPQPWNIALGVPLSAIVVLIGVSRVYLGAHFPTDVLAGWSLGGIFLLLTIKYVLA